ncbi:hypothetical protein D3C87_2010280 [compost metagenome]
MMTDNVLYKNKLPFFAVGPMGKRDASLQIRRNLQNCKVRLFLQTVFAGQHDSKIDELAVH